MTGQDIMLELIRCIHMAQWSPDRVCKLVHSEWMSLTDGERRYLERLAKMSNISITLGGER